MRDIIYYNNIIQVKYFIYLSSIIGSHILAKKNLNKVNAMI